MLAKFKEYALKVTFDKKLLTEFMTPMKLVWKFDRLQKRRLLFFVESKDEEFSLQTNFPTKGTARSVPSCDWPCFNFRSTSLILCLGILHQQGAGFSIYRGFSDPLAFDVPLIKTPNYGCSYGHCSFGAFDTTGPQAKVQTSQAMGLYFPFFCRAVVSVFLNSMLSRHSSQKRRTTQLHTVKLTSISNPCASQPHFAPHLSPPLE